MSARRRHVDADAALHDLLDRVERAEMRESGTRVVSVLVSQSFVRLEDEAAFRRRIEAAMRTGSVRLEMDRGELSHLMKRVVLVDAQALYSFLDRRPRRDAVADAHARLAAELDRRLSPAMAQAGRAALARLAGSWAGGARPHRLEPGGDAALEFCLAWGVVRGRSPDDRRDLRTLSRQELGDSKLIERHLVRVLGEARETGLVPEDLVEEEACAALDLEKFPHLVQLAGDLGGEIGAAYAVGAHLGVHPERIEALPARPLSFLMCVENYASFNRMVRECPAPGAAILYTGGWPDRGTRRAIARLAARADRVLHWGDIDMAGAEIADAVWRAAGRAVELHLMDPELARAKGARARERASRIAEASPARALADWLASEEAFVLEQEELDPRLPRADGSASAQWRSVSAT